MSEGWDNHEKWRSKTDGALAVLMGRALLIDLVVGSRLPWTTDEYIGAMRRAYLRMGVECPIPICRDFVKYVIPDEYIRDASERSVPDPKRVAATSSVAHLRNRSTKWPGPRGGATADG